jgi:N-methylhydantoinase A
LPTDGPLEIGVDVGGTFTDIICSGPEGMQVLKIPTSAEQSEAILEGVRALGSAVRKTSLFSHATTIATNALLTKTGLARTALITNEGFRDVLEIGRQRRPELYSLRTRRPVPLVRRRDRFTVGCRMDSAGAILVPLRRSAALGVAKRVIRGNFESVAVCFLHSYANPAHELEMRGALADAGFRGSVSLSCEVDREYREYERTSTTAVNAVLVPLMSGYLERLERSLRLTGARAPVYVMNSDGGMSTSRFASARPVAAVESGPAAGVLASRQLARELSLDRVLTFDMGGTTAKAGAVVGGEPEVVDEFEAAGKTHSGRSIKGSGYAVRGSFIDLAEVSAGGGTVAWIDEGGALAAGPRSAGSSPGPACYGAGGSEPTVTDANVVLGRLNPEYLLGGKMKIEGGLARESLAKLGRELGMTAPEAAEGVVRLVNNSMAKAMSIVSVERGRDPRDFVMIAFGGSGPVHSCDIAEDLGVREVIVPAHAGMFSAYGLLTADLTRTFVSPVPDSARSLKGLFGRLEAQAAEEMKKEGLPAFTVGRFVEARYAGQSHELLLPYRGDRGVRSSFDRRHREIYGYASDDRLQMVSIKVKAFVSRGRAPPMTSSTEGMRSPPGRRRAWLSGTTAQVPVLGRDALSAGDAGKGPCIIEEYDSTLVVNPGWGWRIESYGTRLRR